MLEWFGNQTMTLNMLFSLLRNPSTLQTGNCCACQPITVFQKGKQIICNFSGKAIETVKQNQTDFVFISNTESMGDFSTTD